MQREEDRRGKMLGIEILRFLSAISVLIFHYKNFTYLGLSRIDKREELFPYHDILWPLYKYGDYGVQVFWALSGFIFFWKYREAVANGLVGGGRFFILRFSRLYPLHVLTLVMVAVLQFAYTDVHGEPFACEGNDLFHFVLHLFMASSWRGQWGLSFNAPIWSVSVEVLVYALFFVLLRCGLKSAWTGAAIVLASVVARHLGADNRVLMCVGFFYAGGLASMLDKQIALDGRERGGVRALCLSLAVLLPVVYGLGFYQGGHGNLELLFLTLWVPLLILCLARIHVDEHGPVAKVLEVAGNVTYASYLLHFPLQLGVALVFVGKAWRVPFESSWLLCAYLSITLLLSVGVYRWFEVPVQAWIRQALLKPRNSLAMHAVAR